MRKEFKNTKAKQKNGIKAIGLSFLRDKKCKRERRRGEEEEEREEEEKKNRRKGERKSKMYETLYRFVWIHVCGLWVVRNLTLEQILVWKSS